jgi:hypothetical protein
LHLMWIILTDKGFPPDSRGSTIAKKWSVTGFEPTDAASMRFLISHERWQILGIYVSLDYPLP